jgi:hypothetical protein
MFPLITSQAIALGRAKQGPARSAPNLLPKNPQPCGLHPRPRRARVLFGGSSKGSPWPGCAALKSSFGIIASSTKGMSLANLPSVEDICRGQ